MKTNRIVITGGPSTGKTAIIDNLKKLGYSCYDEVIRKLTTEAQKTGEIVKQHSNPIALVNDALDFNKRLLDLRLNDFLNGEGNLSFYDRGMPDVLAYMDYFNQSIPKEFNELCETHNYDTIFILPPWQEIFKSDSQRFENYEQATEIYKYLKQTYKHLGYTCIEIPKQTIAKRTAFIISSIEAICNNQ